MICQKSLFEQTRDLKNFLKELLINAQYRNKQKFMATSVFHSEVLETLS